MLLLLPVLLVACGDGLKIGVEVNVVNQDDADYCVELDDGNVYCCPKDAKSEDDCWIAYIS